MPKTLLLLARFQAFLLNDKTCKKDLVLNPHQHSIHLSDESIRFGFCIFAICCDCLLKSEWYAYGSDQSSLKIMAWMEQK